MKPEPSYMTTSRGTPFKIFLTVLFCILLETTLWILFYGVFTETIGLMSNLYLSELPGVSGLFEAIDEEMTVSHLLAALLSFFSVATPIFIWTAILNERVYDDPATWISDPLNRIKAIVWVTLFLLVSGIEAVNLYSLISAASTSGPLPVGDPNPWMDYLSNNQGLAIFISILLTIINAVIALITAKTTFNLSATLRGE